MKTIYIYLERQCLFCDVLKEERMFLKFVVFDASQNAGHIIFEKKLFNNKISITVPGW